ncbi:WxL domain-containing protein [Enterococcus gilvus]|uniref:WxL domain-containing protein n=1 Tax=Enterococcus gilvus TaxID=160453 RepID=UPI001C8B95E8|nr:WxL domain-containing protein [Enterococcus gilvus]MBX8938819.1 hypothetical protein [Enterococcus gilvus]
MKKTILGLGVVLVSTALLGGQSAFAAVAGSTPSPATAQTPVTATFAAPTTTPNPLPPTPSVPHGPSGNLGIAYTPAPMSFSGTLTTGAMSLAEASATPAHVGVKDTSFDTKGWDLTAQLAWTGSAVAGAEIKATSSAVQENINDGITAFNPATDLVALPASLSGSLTSTTALTIGTAAPVNTLVAADGGVYTGTYDVELSSITLDIPSGGAVSAGTYNGNINWDLSVHP